MANGKGTLFFDGFTPEEWAEVDREAARLSRAFSWVVQQSWRIARVRLRNLPPRDPNLERARRKGQGAHIMPTNDKRKQSLYFPDDMLQEIQYEATRQDRSLSWMVQQAWRIARSEISRFPSADGTHPGTNTVNPDALVLTPPRKMP